MSWRVAEIATDGLHLARERGFLLVSDQSTEVGRIPFDDLGAVVANAHGITYSNSLLVELCQRGVPLVVCSANHLPAGVLWPMSGHHQQAGRMDAQLAAKLPLRKRIWAEIIRAKIIRQAALLDLLGLPALPLRAMARKVRAGDPTNFESQAARAYWPAIFGKAFRRDRSAAGPNALLNYGYAILRATTARAIIAAGLHPSIGLHHSNKLNGMVLVDDLMEPYRPYVDLRVHALVAAEKVEVNAETKRVLAEVMAEDLSGNAGTTPLQACVQRTATSLAMTYAGERDGLEFPHATMPEALARFCKSPCSPAID
ncbi:MAG: type II CRISPR-associated endonuclease Cas1 [Betaproteobacteria bacterium]